MANSFIPSSVPTGFPQSVWPGDSRFVSGNSFFWRASTLGDGPNSLLPGGGGCIYLSVWLLVFVFDLGGGIVRVGVCIVRALVGLFLRSLYSIQNPGALEDKSFSLGSVEKKKKTSTKGTLYFFSVRFFFHFLARHCYHCFPTSNIQLSNCFSSKVSSYFTCIALLAARSQSHP